MYKDAKLRTLVDPCTDMVSALNRFLDWFSMARRLLFPVADAPELQKRDCKLLQWWIAIVCNPPYKTVQTLHVIE